MATTSPVKTPPKVLHGVLADFSSPEKLLHAVKAARAQGYTKMEAYTPFPIHGIDDAMGAPQSKLGYISVCFGVLGMSAALLMIWWMGAVSYPLVIGGKPLFALEFSIPITFELTVLFSAFATVFGMFGLNKLPQLYHPVFNYQHFKGATDDRFLLVIEATDTHFEPIRTGEFLRGLGSDRQEILEA
jgi:hypothetical protein